VLARAPDYRNWRDGLQAAHGGRAVIANSKSQGLQLLIFYLLIGEQSLMIISHRSRFPSAAGAMVLVLEPPPRRVYEPYMYHADYKVLHPEHEGGVKFVAHTISGAKLNCKRDRVFLEVLFHPFITLVFYFFLFSLAD